MERELSEILGRRVDLNTPGFLSPYFRDDVLASADVLFNECEDRRRRAVG
jgi:predicted nucleotidyltransferase